jgi:radical SAM protein with 4Fe4S-binding SPASM domain
MCLVRYRPTLGRHSASLPLARFEALLDALPTVDEVTLQGLGEPLLAPDLLAMVRLAKQRGTTVGFNTNATKLTPERAEELVAAGLDWLVVSLDGATAATYEAIRDGARFEHVVANVAGLVAAKRAAGAEHPDLAFAFVAMRRNLAELPALVRLAAELGVPTVKVQNLSHDFGDVTGAEAYVAIRGYTEREALWRGGDEARVAATFAEAKAVAAATGVVLHLPAPPDSPHRRAAGAPGCSWPWDELYVTHDGTVQPCCMVMGTDRAAWGSTATASPAAIWSGDEAVAFRRALLTDEPPRVCRGCSLYRGVF